MTDHLETAHDLALRICQDAVHHRGICTWVCGSTLGGDLYGGTAGIGLALSEIAAQTGDRAMRATGLAALRHALVAADAFPEERRLGLFTGRLGIGLAVLRGASVAEDESLIARATRSLSEIRVSDADVAPRYDLLGGMAGAVIGLLIADEALDRPALRSDALRLGDDILAAARTERGTRSWPSHGAVPARADLTGFSHGAAGIAHALSEIAEVTGEDRFRAGAEEAYAYERRLVDAAGNWPDLRDLGQGPGFAVRSRFAWCHGAPGIVLARHRAWTRTQDPLRADEVRAGGRLTVRWLRAALNTDRGRFCLCHGIAGNAEILIECADVIQDPTLADVVAGTCELARSHLRSGEPWPCTGPWDEHPSLMTGLAGIARFHLRLHDPRIPTVLLPSPGQNWMPGRGQGLGFNGTDWRAARALTRPQPSSSERP